MTAAKASVNKRGVPPREPVASMPPAPAPIRSPGAQAAIDRVKARALSSYPLARIKAGRKKSGEVRLEFESLPDGDTDKAGFLDACGTHDNTFALGVLGRLLDVLPSKDGIPSEEAINWAHAALRGIAPRNETETMLASMMVATHLAAMNAMSRLAGASMLRSAEFQLNVATKMARTHAALAATLRTYRSGGTQRVVVEHVTVNAGGQAIVGAVATGGGPGVRDEREG